MRDGAILLFYDLCTENKDHRCEYRNFVKYLKSEGYISLQESVFFKYIRNVSMAKFSLDRIGKMPITQGKMFCLVLSYRTFKKMVVLHGGIPDFDSIKAPYIYL